ncbi:MAG: tetratricopeptide repeat protein [Gemmatimonadetes bacterium]|nr:tetratricopeptide repeat protein [Gemmatimonadota bacterium]
MLAALFLALAAVQGPELVSPLGRPLFARADTAGVVAKAESVVARAPHDVDSLLRLGQTLASVWRYHDAIDVYSRAIALASGRAILYRHRGHRYISTRQFGKAIADLDRAAELDSTSFDIWYHLGLAYYLTGRFAHAARAYRRCVAAADSPDNLVAVSDWLWMSLRRAGEDSAAAAVLAGIRDSLDVRENTAYYNRLLFYQGRRMEADLRALMATGDLEFATVGYGLATWHLIRGDTTTARALFRQIVAGTYWPAFGFIAAETELLRTP